MIKTSIIEFAIYLKAFGRYPGAETPADIRSAHIGIDI